MYSFYIDNRKANFQPVSTQMTTIPKQVFPLMNKIIYSKNSLI